MPLLSRTGGFLNRLKPFLPAGEALRVERTLAAARAFLTTAALVAIYLDPAEPSRYVGLAYGLLAAFVVSSTAIWLYVRFRPQLPESFPLAVHVADIVWPVLITAFTLGPNSPFFVLLVFVLVAAAYRWGLRETMLTAIGAIVVLLAQSALLATGLLGQDLMDDVELNRLILRSAYLLVLGFLLGFLAEQEKQLRAETATLAQVVSRARVESGLNSTLRSIFSDLLRIFGARSALLAVREERSGQSLVWECSTGQGDDVQARQRRPGAAELRDLFAPLPRAFFAQRPTHGKAITSFALDRRGWRTRPPEDLGAVGRILEANGATSLYAVAPEFGEDWEGRLFLFDPAHDGDREAELAFLQTLARQVAPVVYSVYLVARLRSRAGAIERARVARELHDGSIQSLIGLEMQLDVLRRHLPGHPHLIEEQLHGIQVLLKEEVLKLRELMQQMLPVEVGPRELLDHLAHTVERFRRETGISAAFHSPAEEVRLAPRVGREVVRILQEALVNVRKHSGASDVVVRFGPENSDWVLSIDDNGRGFPFQGRLEGTELENSRRGPRVLKERVRAISGRLTIESAEGRGSRIEVRFPQQMAADYE